MYKYTVSPLPEYSSDYTILQFVKCAKHCVIISIILNKPFITQLHCNKVKNNGNWL